MEIDPRITQHRTHFYLKTLKEGKNNLERWIAVSFIISLATRYKDVIQISIFWVLRIIFTFY